MKSKVKKFLNNQKNKLDNMQVYASNLMNKKVLKRLIRHLCWRDISYDSLLQTRTFILDLYTIDFICEELFKSLAYIIDLFMDCDKLGLLDEFKDLVRTVP